MNSKILPSETDNDTSIVERGFVFAVIILPFVGLIYAIVALCRQGVPIFYPLLAFFLYVATGLGITIGFHRLFTHESFKTHASFKLLFAILGAMAVQGRLIEWCARHHHHHQETDTEEDPSSYPSSRTVVNVK